MRTREALARMARREALVDGGMLLVLGAVALWGFHDTFDGARYLVAGVVGLLLGILVAHVANVLGQPVIVLAVFALAAFFLLGGAVALHGGGAVSVLPLPDTLVSLADQSVHGWKELLTTLPPVDGGPLLTLPYLLGLVAGAGGMALAGRLRSAWLAALAPLALLGTVILLGVQTPGETALLGAVFAAGSVAWVVLRARRLRRTTRIGGRMLRQRLLAVGLCAAATGLGVYAGPSLPGTGSDRVVLRSHVTPPFDVGQYPSPLAGFRRYTKGFAGSAQSRLYDKAMLSVTGIPEGTRIRLATLDSYSGTVWGAANDAGTEPGTADTFQKVGSRIDNPVEGRTVSGRIRVEEGYSGVWLPTVGALQRIEFGSALEGDAEHFRYNLGSGTAVLPSGLASGDEYAVTAVLPDDELHPDTALAAGALPVEQGSRFRELATQWSATASTPMEQVLAVAKHLRTVGRYTNGGDGQEEYRPGHSLSRLALFVAQGRQIAGDDEQYAALMAIAANELGVPARVVMGAVLPPGGEVRGKDVHAWVELRSGDGSWRTLPTEEFMSTERPPDDENPPELDQKAGRNIPPPTPVRPPSSTGDPISDALNQLAADDGSDQGWSLRLPGWLVALATYVGGPLLVLCLLAGAIVLAKRQRRTLRRTRGRVDQRVAQAYRDVLDQARDLGLPVHAGRTRREQARALGLAGVSGLADGADAQIFGPGLAGEPEEELVARFWDTADAVRSEMLEGLGRWSRLKAALNLASFLPMQKEGAGT